MESDYEINLWQMVDAHPVLEFVLGPAADIIGWQFDYRWLAAALLLTVACMIAVYLGFRPAKLSWRSFLRVTLPARVYLNSSSRIDYACLFIYPGLLTVLSYLGVELVSESQVGAVVEQSLHNIGNVPVHLPEHVVLTAAVFVLGAIIGDFSQFTMHVLYHRVPALWEFHKAHHSAKVLTPFTGSRDHPLIFILDTFAYALCVGLYVGVLDWIDPAIMDRAYLWEASAIVFLLYFFGFLTSHYHLPVRFGLFEWILVSPAFHMAHHVNHPDYYNKNYGHIFSFWDRLFATMVAPVTDLEDLTFGIEPDENRRYEGVIKLHLAPFSGLCRLLRGP
jgi:sterol desaturase/sphingolipid hydroxylase (fatty acid hydroxylase superfamily)